mmetsp:Transcript_26504/g.81511  ORF Transcript_26504/g.81511 Transcript_26504/m.81511 type:complete len:93 (-) Transcript_26504:388-666(-)
MARPLHHAATPSVAPPPGVENAPLLPPLAVVASSRRKNFCVEHACVPSNATLSSSLLGPSSLVAEPQLCRRNYVYSVFSLRPRRGVGAMCRW